MKTVKQICVLLLGTVICGFGIDMAINAGFGGATLAVMWAGVSKTLNITVGQASFIIAVIMAVFCFFYDRRQISWGTVINQAVYSLCIDLFRPLMRYTEYPVVNFFIMILGLIILGIGVAIYSYADFGRGSYEALTFALSEKNGWPLKYVRMTLDALWVILGVILGGTFGLCTVATVLLSGIVIQKTTEILKKHHAFKLN